MPASIAIRRSRTPLYFNTMKGLATSAALLARLASHESAGCTRAPLAQAAASGVRSFASKGDADPDEVCLCQEECRVQPCVRLEFECFPWRRGLRGCCTLDAV